ncbi:septal ring lytic transglycosylase RlpA family protein [Treponema sp.]|uniref:septal ring lytic transglycosylase RlpA family protein n=1 Tax=Treponema sp. TaxID=166 RepID=UPI00298D6572|nr:septal ring lytic transglycosylase RlpA family protein [Treponema sp.]MCR5613182.1 septal ring lytic transglycosylase RlpA family protein [Treponema sp.]
MKKSLIFICLCVGFLNFAHSAALYKASATASYYAEAFHGKKTSNGERFNMYALTCAHKMLPFNTVLKVTNLSNGRSVQVRVNDRGPFVGTREIDLSKAAAVQLGMIGSGTAKVRLEIVKLGKYTKQSVVTAKKACSKAGIKYYQVSPPDSAGESDAKSGAGLSSGDANGPGTSAGVSAPKFVKQSELVPGKKWDIQLASFSSRENALKFARKVKKSGFENVVLQKTKTSVRVTIKEVKSENVNKEIERLFEKGYKDVVVRARKSD